MASTAPHAPTPAPASVFASASPPPPLLITVRFSTSQPELAVEVPLPHHTTVLAFKHTLRGRIVSKSRLRLIYQGRVLADPVSLATVFKPLLATPPPPPPRSSPPPPPPPPPSSQDIKGKGRAAPLGEDYWRGRRLLPVKVYLNCSIGDEELSVEELAAEEAAALNPSAAETSAEGISSVYSDYKYKDPYQQQQQGGSASTTRPRPRGFDRLLQAGFSTSEIATLRTQFASIRSQRYAPDAAPSPDTLRAMEDSWIDGNAGELSSAPGRTSLGGGGYGDDDLDGLAGLVDAIISAMTIGFFFPLGSLTWLLRQPIWSERWRIFVTAGLILSMMVGFFMTISG